MADGVNERFDFTDALPRLAQIPAVHLIAIGGAGMSAVAGLFLAHGVRVSGSDRAEGPAIGRLRAAGALITLGQQASTVMDLAAGTVVVVSSAVTESNPELMAARARGMRVLHRSQALAALSREGRVFAVAGANGKTTSSAMAVVALRDAGAGPSFAIGADIAGVGSNAGTGSGSAFVIEADESDGSFVVYRPAVALVTNVRDDHLDFYGTSRRLHAAYDDFVSSMKPGGLLVACADDEGSLALARRHAGAVKMLTYGRSEQADLRMGQPHSDEMSWSTSVQFPSGDREVVQLAVPGEHNLLNAAGVALSLSAGFDLSPQEVVHGLGCFRGTSRRFELRGTAGGVRVVDDYAHNPDKLAAVISTGLALRGSGRLIVVFQPHLYSRTRAFAQQFSAALRMADLAFVMDVYGAREDPIPGVTGELLSGPVAGAAFVPTAQQAVDAVLQTAREGDLVLTVGAGDVTGLGPLILDALARHNP